MFHRFIDRKDAALALAPFLGKYRNEQTIVLAVPRGGVPVAYHIAKNYNLPIELLMTKKIGHPAHPEFAIGAVSLEDHIIDEGHGVSQFYIDAEIRSIRKSLQERYRKFMGEHKPPNLEDKILIIVDDGMATGNTILSSIKMLRRQNPKKIIVAVPVAPSETIEKVRKQVDDLICLYSPKRFIGVGLHYKNFDQVSNGEVIRLLKDANPIDNAA